MWNIVKSTALGGLMGLATLIAPVASAHAADIYDKYGARQSSPYDDPRYADIYNHPTPHRPRYAEPRYVEPAPPYAEPRYDRPYAQYDDAYRVPRDRYGYLKPVLPPRHHPPHAQPGCLHRDEIRRALVAEGWRDFHDLELRSDVALVRAYRPNGHAYALKVDRCTGEIIHARPLEHRPIPYANRDRYNERTF